MIPYPLKFEKNFQNLFFGAASQVYNINNFFLGIKKAFKSKSIHLIAKISKKLF
jgi:hypothetical protein